MSDYALFQVDLDGRIQSWNLGAERLLGWKEEEAIGQSASLVFTPEDVAAGEAERELKTALRTGRAEDERWHLRKDGSRFFASGVLTPVADSRGQVIGFAKVMRDVTGHKEYEERLKQAVEQKSTLVREIHHRVKNNLQVVASLLNMQARHTQHPDVLHVEQAIPLGLIANELILNSLKDGMRGTNQSLQVSLRYVPESYHPEHGETPEDGWVELAVRDARPGFPAGFDPAQTTSLGLRLVNLLARQLRGRFETGSGAGALAVVRFPLKRER